jgi:hypothetical protein
VGTFRDMRKRGAWGIQVHERGKVEGVAFGTFTMVGWERGGHSGTSIMVSVPDMEV